VRVEAKGTQLHAACVQALQVFVAVEVVVRGESVRAAEALLLAEHAVADTRRRCAAALCKIANQKLWFGLWSDVMCIAITGCVALALKCNG
jgi:hypothetical protein